MKKYQTNSATETQKIAADLASCCKNGGIIALSGPLGSGKTTFIQGFAKTLGITQNLISPTFILIRSYPIPENNQGQLFHIDLYRLENKSQIETIGLSDILDNPYNITLIEWAERLDKLPENTIKINIAPKGENSREIEVIE
ncbi:tRNA (adenosine(37)-N6)-threonylcarbamoyltransferase complex ATPase subunit type 1 TsaE [Candidatus Daviesbacteria bacterium RIFCSPLOWO2_02_FULL_40_8]|nr:MAG: tRNA (adenosine(37)-N6)-threonylcarbamoyltransferase complex ATPase subunit type 1 TsaE [Candidatus Daviesbacteria bacterium RIFCSPHIGHO2_02_FULL_41_14]OGE66811.1 MAG: tRNA (adenosine(37)-N6)-threonylcarbamoyltransferase complex ATPase subunit type 1 TsaE [Candidatus Daviesbacteria bacterium RIFCSPLOWO2_02_FULL_40_8]